MSGIVGIVHRSGKPVDRFLFKRMVDSLSFRGPDGLGLEAGADFGFGHTLLRTVRESRDEKQPLSLDGSTWITADARIDDRSTLVRELGAPDAGRLLAGPDAVLILLAYGKWGPDCVKHLIGDFAFAIWDGRKKALFCARDQFGVKPFYYAAVEDGLVISNTLNCVRMHPEISASLNDLAIGDFLLFGFNQDLATTTFADILRLPPAHSLTWTDGMVRIERYWTLPIDHRIRYKRSRDYADHFNEIFDQAVGDRLRTDRISVLMSGGLDSTSIAAAAANRLRKDGAAPGITAYTYIYEKSVSDQEGRYAKFAAAFLGIPVRYFPSDDCPLYEGWEEDRYRFPEPHRPPCYGSWHDSLITVASNSKVVLEGEGGDPAFIFSRACLRRLFSERRIEEFSRDILRGVFLPGLWRTALSFLIRKAKNLSRSVRAADEGPYPGWLNPAFEDKWALKSRFGQDFPPPGPPHPIRPLAHSMLFIPFWPHYFEICDPGFTRVPLEFRYPFFDFRLLDYLYSIPPIPWAIDKTLLRAANKGKLPRSIRSRPKTPLLANPELEVLRKDGKSMMRDFRPLPELSEYIDIPAFLTVSFSAESCYLNTRPTSLNYWLRGYRERF